MSPHDTIVAIATPPGRAGLGVVRLSGPAAHAIACALVGRSVPLEPRRATFARVSAGPAEPTGVPDEVVCTWFPAPRSYTGDEVVELTGHGNPMVLGGIVDRAVAAGARLLLARIDDLLSGARRGRVIREGARVVLAGPPNAGKSSLFNRLLAAERAIVSPRAGTTRDLLTERCEVRGIAVTLVDTAGLAEARDPEDRDGVDRARAAAANADLVVLVLDGATPLGPEIAVARDGVPGGRLVVAVNKADLGHAWPLDRARLRVAPDVSIVRVSARTGAGVEALRAALTGALGTDGVPARDTPTVTNQRHAAVLVRVRESLCRAQDALRQGEGDELVASDLREARAVLAEVTGHGLPGEVLAAIFARFCVGK